MNIKNEILATLQGVESTLEVSFALFTSEGVSPNELRLIIEELAKENLIKIIMQNDRGVVISRA